MFSFSSQPFLENIMDIQVYSEVLKSLDRSRQLLVFCKKVFYEDIWKIHMKTPMMESYFSQVVS